MDSSENSQEIGDSVMATEEQNGEANPQGGDENVVTDSIIGPGGDAEGGLGKGNEERHFFDWEPFRELNPGLAKAAADWTQYSPEPDNYTAFREFGEVTQAQVKYDQATGRSRGFAFVEFAAVSGCRTALDRKDREIKGKKVEVKPAKSRENKKVFVGGLPSDFTEDDLRKHFSEFGEVEDIEWPFDRQRNVRRNFAFVVFEEESGADLASQTTKQKFGERMCDVKKAVPQPKRFAQGFGMGAAAARGGRGATRGRGGGYYGPTAGWGAATANWYGQGGWGDWYGSAPAAAYGSGGYSNYYGAGYGNYGGGYYDTDYSGNNYDSYWSGWSQYAGAGGASASTAGSYDAYGQHAQSPVSTAALRGRYQPY